MQQQLPPVTSVLQRRQRVRLSIADRHLLFAESVTHRSESLLAHGTERFDEFQLAGSLLTSSVTCLEVRTPLWPA